jgi:hypothetical protein
MPLEQLTYPAQTHQQHWPANQFPNVGWMLQQSPQVPMPEFRVEDCNGNVTNACQGCNASWSQGLRHCMTCGGSLLFWAEGN